MKFPYSEELALPCTFERVVQGELHSDGRRYLPLLLFRLDALNGDTNAPQMTPPGMLLGVVDRHHRVDLELVGQRGAAQLVFLLGPLRIQEDPPQQGLVPEGQLPDRASTRPLAFGRVVRVPAWEANRGQLAYETLYTELLLDIGGATLGVRTSATADDLGASIGKATIEPGDWVVAGPSRIDILGFGL
jgi:hypothetical protein